MVCDRRIEMERRIYTAQDAEQFEKAEEQLRKNGFDAWTPEGSQHNAGLVDEYFQANPAVPVNVQNIFKCIEARKQGFKWISLAQVKWYETAQKNLDLANQLAEHLATHGGRPGQLANAADELFANLVLLVNEINTHPQPIAHAENRIAHRPGKHLQYVPQPRRTEPVSPAALADDEQPFLGSDLVKMPDGSFRSNNVPE